jgi:hypothetical protein
VWPTSSRFSELIQSSHAIATKVEIVRDDVVIADLSALGVVVDGSVTASHSPVQRSGEVTLVDRDGTLTPSDLTDLLVPAGNQIRLWRGVQYPAQTDALLQEVPTTTSELVPIGTFRFISTDLQFPKIDLHEVYDRAWVVQGAQLESVLTIAQGTPYVDAITNILQTAYPGVPTNFPDTDEVTSLMTFDAETDPWQVAQNLAANIGMRLFFDPMGVAQLVPETNPDTDPIVWTFDSTAPINSTLGGTTRNLFGGSSNAVVVIAENTALPAPLRAVAYDLDPLSPTRYGGPYGKRPTFIRDEKIASQAQADHRAIYELQSLSGTHESLELLSLVNPAFEIGDIIQVYDPLRKVDCTCIVDRIVCPLRAKTSMQISTRLRQEMPVM